MQAINCESQYTLCVVASDDRLERISYSHNTRNYFQLHGFVDGIESK